MSASKLTKAIIFTAQASETHTGIKTRNVLRWLKSGFEVKVLIKGKADRHKAMESIANKLEDEAKSGVRVLQKVIKPESIKFILRPTELASEIKIDDNELETESVDDLTIGKDILSEDFEKELERSIQEESLKKRKK